LSALALGLYARIAWPWTPLGWVALVPWLAVLDRATSWRAGSGTALLMAGPLPRGAVGGGAPAGPGHPRGPGAPAPALRRPLAPLLQPQLLAFAVARHVARRRGAGGARVALAGAFAWVGTEWACPKLFGDTLGYGLWPCAWMRQAADVAGVPGLTLVLLLGNECVLAATRALTGAAPRRALVPAAGL